MKSELFFGKNIYKNKLDDDFKTKQSKVKRFKQIESSIIFNYLSENKTLPKKDEIVEFLSKGQISTIDIFEWILKSEIVKEIFIVTFRIGKKESEKLINLLKHRKQIKKITIICSTTQKDNDKANSLKHENEKYNYLKNFKEKLNELGHDIYLKNIHSKIYLFKTDKDYFVLKSSANLNKNSKNEFYEIFNNKDSYYFNKNFYEEMI